MGSYNRVEANEKKSIEIWLGHLKVSKGSSTFITLLMPPNSTKSSAKSSHTSLQSTSSSVSNAARSSAKAIGRGLKRIRKGATAIVRPLKRTKQLKHALSNVSSPAISEVEDAEDQASLKTGDSPEVIELGSDEELEDLEKELGPSKFSYFVTSILMIHSGGQGNLEVPDILVLPI
jgi:hypothetical protein